MKRRISNITRWGWGLAILFWVSAGCSNATRSQALARKEDSLRQKEQELLLRETAVELKEEALLRKEQRLDSNSRIDSSYRVDSAFIGNWNVIMTCTEATCPGSAVGDTKNEMWHLAYEGQNLIATATTGGKLIRTYTGFYTGNTIELLEKRDTLVSQVKMVVRLRPIDETNLEGQREIIRENCKVIYELKLKKDE